MDTVIDRLRTIAANAHDAANVHDGETKRMFEILRDQIALEIISIEMESKFND